MEKWKMECNKVSYNNEKNLSYTTVYGNKFFFSVVVLGLCKVVYRPGFVILI